MVANVRYGSRTTDSAQQRHVGYAPDSVRESDLSCGRDVSLDVRSYLDSDRFAAPHYLTLRAQADMTTPWHG